jgi:hypothetical protein
MMRPIPLSADVFGIFSVVYRQWTLQKKTSPASGGVAFSVTAQYPVEQGWL